MRNGADKTTTMRAVFGLTALDVGTVRWNGAPVTQAERRRFGYLPEERGRYPGMLAGEQLEYLGPLHGVSAWQFALSAAISVACTFGVARLATAVYRASILRTGPRVSLRALLAR